MLGPLSFQAFDPPSEDAVTAIWAPETATVGIVRDRFGKPYSITRSGSYGGSGMSVTRSYVYDGYQRLCKTIEPEAGATVQAYDGAGHVAWRASGLGLPSTTSCDQSSVPGARAINYGYDVHGRLTSTSHGDGSPGISRSYTADGLPWQISTPSSTWTLTYNNRRLLTQESLNLSGNIYTFTYQIDSHANVASLTYPYGPSVAYAPNALGEPTQVSGYASGVTHHPNGAIAGYTLANGIAHSLSQNSRGLPLVWRDAGVVQDQYGYDANANVTSIADQQEGISSRAMGYDGLDRLTAGNGLWGAGSFGYDPLDNLRTSTVGSRSTSATIDAANRLASLNVNGAVTSIGYDPNGNVIQRGAQGFVFDIANRMSSAPGKASYGYDGLGRRSWLSYADGTLRHQVYGQAGNLLLGSYGAQGITIHVHLGERLIAETNSLTGTTFVHTDALGSPVARTSSSAGLLSRTRYEPYGATAAGTIPNGIGFTGHVNDADTGLVYMQQRYYDPIAGRFLSVDPVTTDAKSGSHFNRYVYANNNPYSFIDPDGQAPEGVIRQINREFEKAQAQPGPGQASALQGLLGRYIEASAGSPSSAPNVVHMTSAVVNAQLSQGGGPDAATVAPAAAAALSAGMIGGSPTGSGVGGTAAATRAANIANGIPASKLGPSGNPKFNVVQHSGMKEAKDAARATVGAGGTTVKHASPAVGGSHFHGETQSGVKDRAHHEY